MADYYVTPQDFGAVADGVTDDRAAFVAAVAAVTTAGTHYKKTIVVPGGTYKWSSGTLLIPDYVTIEGHWGLTAISSNQTIPVFAAAGADTARTRAVHITGIQFNNTTKNNAGAIGIDMRNAAYWRVDNCWFANIETGVRLYGDLNGEANGAYYNQVERSEFQQVKTGVLLDSVYPTSCCNDNRIANNRMGGVDTGIYFKSGYGNQSNCNSVEGGGIGVRVGATTISTVVMNARHEGIDIGVQVDSGAVNVRIYPLHLDATSYQVLNNAGSQCVVIGPSSATTPPPPPSPVTPHRYWCIENTNSSNSTWHFEIEPYDSTGKLTLTSGMLSNSGSGFGSFSATNLVNGDHYNSGGFWLNSGSTGNRVKIDFGSGNEKALNKIALWSSNDANDMFTVKYSDNGTDYTAVSGTLNTTGSGSPHESFLTF